MYFMHTHFHCRVVWFSLNIILNLWARLWMYDSAKTTTTITFFVVVVNELSEMWFSLINIICLLNGINVKLSIYSERMYKIRANKPLEFECLMEIFFKPHGVSVIHNFVGVPFMSTLFSNKKTKLTNTNSSFTVWLFLVKCLKTFSVTYGKVYVRQ